MYPMASHNYPQTPFGWSTTLRPSLHTLVQLSHYFTVQTLDLFRTKRGQQGMLVPPYPPETHLIRPKIFNSVPLSTSTFILLQASTSPLLGCLSQFVLVL